MSKAWECPECGTLMVVSDKAGLAALETLAHDQTLAIREDNGLLLATLARALSDKERREAQLSELIMAVGTKYPGESRHQTALRYIQEAEQRGGGPATDALSKDAAE